MPEDRLRNGFRDSDDGYGFGLGVRARMDETKSSAVLIERSLLEALEQAG